MNNPTLMRNSISPLLSVGLIFAVLNIRVLLIKLKSHYLRIVFSIISGYVTYKDEKNEIMVAILVFAEYSRKVTLANNKGNDKN